MARFFKILFLLLFIAACGTLVYLKIQSLGSENSKFNQTTRFKLAKYGWLRIFLGLHNDGDARGWYFAGKSPLILEVVVAKGVEFNDGVLRSVAKKAENVLGRKVQIINSDLIANGRLSDGQLAEEVKKHRHYEISGQPNLFVIYAEDFQREGGYVGQTFQEFGIVLSDKRLREVTADYPYSLDGYIESTLLHELGHQLGLDHNQQEDCVMNEKVDQPDGQGTFSGRYTPTDFCDLEINQLNSIKASLK